MAVSLYLVIVLLLGLAETEVLTDSNRTRYTDEKYMSPILRDISARLKHLETLHTEDAEKINRLQLEVNELKSVNLLLNEKLETSVSTCEDMITNSAFGSKEHSFKNAKNHVSDPDKEQNKTHQLTTSHQKIRQIQETHSLSTNGADSGSHGDEPMVNVAFHATMDHTVRDPGVNTELVFEHILTNIGNSYSKETGTFTCKHSGIYVFLWSTFVNAKHYIDTHIVKNGAIISSTIGATGFHGNSGTGFAVLPLEIDDRVWIKVGNHDTGTNIYDRFSMFSGFKL